MTIRLQHEDAKLEELRGRTCSAFLGVEDRNTGFFGPLYLLAESTWHRFYLDAGLLFWEEGFAPEVEEDLLEGERYVDLGDVLGAIGGRLARIEMHDCQLRVEFENGSRLVLRHGVTDEGTRVVERVAAKT